MATPDPQLRYATDEFDADGVTTDWEVSFIGGYINPAHVFAMSGILDPDTQLLTDRTPHTVEVISEAEDSSTVRVDPAVEAGRKLIIFRSTPVAEMLVNYQDGSAITKRNLDLSNDQLLKIIQEMFDNLNIATLSIDQQIGTVVDLNQLIQQIYQEVIDLIAAGGIVSVAPRVWAGAWTGPDVGATDFEIPGADVEEAGFYDVYVNGLGLEPDEDYTIILDPDNTAESVIRFTTVPADGSTWFAVLRGYAKPYTGPPPVTSLRMPVVDVDQAQFFVDQAVEFAFIRSLYSFGAESEYHIKEIPAVGDPALNMGSGSYVSFCQRSTAQVVLVPENPNVTLITPAGYLPRTRAQESVISITCEYGDGNVWVVSGDMAKE